MYCKSCTKTSSIVRNPISREVEGRRLEATPQPFWNPSPTPDLDWGLDPRWPPKPKLGGLEGVVKLLKIVKIFLFS